MLGVAVAPSPVGPTSLPSELASVTSPSWGKLLPLAGKPRAVVLISPAKAPVSKRATMAGRPLCCASASGDVVAGRAAGGWHSSVPLVPTEVLIEARATAADRLLVGAAASPDSDAFRAAGGRSARAVVPIPPPTPAETLVSFRTVAVVAGNCPIHANPRRKIGK